MHATLHPRCSDKLCALVPPGPLDRVLALLLLGSLGLQASWLVLGWGPAGWQQALANALYDLPILLSAVVAWRAATTYPAAGSTAEPNVRRGWLVVALGLSMPVVGNAIWSYHELVLGAEPFPSAADGFYLLFAPLCMVGFLWVARYPLGGARGVRLGLDALILVTAAGLFSWRFMFAPLIFGHEGNALALVFSLAYPALDLVLFSLLALIVLHPAGWNSAGVPLFAAGVGCFIVADVSFAFLVASGAYELGHPVDIFWTASVALIAFSAWADRRRAAPAKAARFAAWVGYLPYLAVASSYALLLYSYTPVRDAAAVTTFRGVLLGTALATALVVLRQMLALADNRRLSRQLGALNADLEARVEARTAELVRVNGELQELSQNLEHKVRTRTAELEASRAKLAYQAHHDALTGLPNRALFEDRLQLAVEAAARAQEPLAVLFIDLDGFKAVNDTFGHPAGDALLQEVARRLSSGLRGGDTVARFGGDEFAVLAPAVGGSADAALLAEALLGVLEPSFELPGPAGGGGSARLGASVGVSLYPGDARDAATLQRHADVAMYRAKQGGKARVCAFSAETDAPEAG